MNTYTKWQLIQVSDFPSDWMKSGTVASACGLLSIWCVCVCMRACVSHHEISSHHTMQEQEQQKDNFVSAFFRFSPTRNDTAYFLNIITTSYLDALENALSCTSVYGYF
jgi:hypothetical protein